MLLIACPVMPLTSQAIQAAPSSMRSGTSDRRVDLLSTCSDDNEKTRERKGDERRVKGKARRRELHSGLERTGFCPNVLLLISLIIGLFL